VERIPLQRAVAVISQDSIAIRPGRRQLVVPLLQASLATACVLVMVLFINSLALWALVVLLGVAILLGPAAVLGLVYSVQGTDFLVERHKGTARWHQGFLGLGIGTFELAPFDRIARIETHSDADDDLSSGLPQDLVTLTVRIVKDNGRAFDVGTVIAPHSRVDRATERANRLATALAEMTGHAAVLAIVSPPDPTQALEGTRSSRDRRTRRRPAPESR
jgi:hypothetical protein